jgi:hypothetical protein
MGGTLFGKHYIIQNIDNEFYYMSHGKWARNRCNAYLFKSRRQARKYMKRYSYYFRNAYIFIDEL